MPTDLATLNNQFAIADHVSFEAGPGDLPMIQVRNAHATATISLQGGQVLAFQPHNQKPVLWVSAQSYYQTGKAIRGGIPVCWPWFGPHPTDATKPAHGFARTSMWSVRSTSALDNGATQVELGLVDSPETWALWPHPFDLQIVVIVGDALQVDLVTHNTGNETFTIGSALHSYFGVSDIGNVAIEGFEGHSYIDQLDPAEHKLQQGAIRFDSEVDRIYLDATEPCSIEDLGSQRRIVNAKQGSRSTVVWNPWIAKAQRMADFGDDEYLRMVCVETANAGPDVIVVSPDDEHHLRAIISTENIS